MIELHATPRAEGEASTECAHLFHAAHQECIEAGVMENESWVAQGLEVLHSEPRIDLYATDDGTVVGGMSLAWEVDPHVGQCAVIRWNYVLPPYRKLSIGKYLFREALRTAARLGFRVIVYTHRVGPWKYLTTYRKLHVTTEAEQEAPARGDQSAGGSEPAAEGSIAGTGEHAPELRCEPSREP